MAKLRRNHQQAAAGGGMITKVGIFAAILGGLFFVFKQFSGEEEAAPASDQEYTLETNRTSDEEAEVAFSEDFLPASTSGEVVQRSYYAFSYSEEHEQAEWVAYKLTRSSLRKPNVDRTGDFRPDPKVRKASASPRDYYATGYDRGHMAPAGDMAFSNKAMSETFYMSNISPQIRNFNGGIWRELEENVRDWAMKFKELYIVTGPVLTEGIRERIGNNQVSVPDLYYKIILDLSEPEIKAIAFLMPNEVSYQPIMDYAVPIDEVERLTGIDFFPNLMDEAMEEALEREIETKLWTTSQKKYNTRVDKWNRRK